MHMHDTLERFRERWRKQATAEKASKRDIHLLKSLPVTRFSIRCGNLYRYSEEAGVELRATVDLCQVVAKLHALGLITLEHGQVQPNEAALDVLINFNKLQA